MNTTKSLKRRIAALVLVAGATFLSGAAVLSPSNVAANGVFID